MNPATLTRSERHVRAARARWGDDPRTVRLDSLDPRVREAVLLLIRADENARKVAEHAS